MTTKTNETTKLPDVTEFYRELAREALKHYHDPRWLGESSLLASPYLLGHYMKPVLEEQQSTAAERGDVLRELIQMAVNTMAQADDTRPLPWARILLDF